MYRVAFVLLACCDSTGTTGSASRAATATARQPIANTQPKSVALSFRVLDLRHHRVILDAEQLTIDGTRASLALSGKSSMMPANGGPFCTQVGSGPEQCKPAKTIEMWYQEVHATMTGTAQQRDTGLVLDFPREDPDAPHLVMTCTDQWFDVAPAKAIVIAGAGCAPLQWSLATERIKVLACTTRNETKPFAVAPGFEEVIPENLNCGERPAMYRRVEADGSVAQALSP